MNEFEERMERLGDALYQHFYGASKADRDAIRKKVQRRRCKNADDRAGQLAFLAMLDEIDKRKNESPKP